MTLVLPTIVLLLLLHIAALDQRQPQKTGVTRTATQRVPLVNSSRSRSADDPFSVNSREHEIVKGSRPCRCERGVPRRGRVRCFCPGLPFASLLKSNNCLLFTRLTSARRCAQGCVQQTQRCKMLRALDRFDAKHTYICFNKTCCTKQWRYFKFRCKKWQQSQVKNQVFLARSPKILVWLL